jgi:hypothetical protein
VVKNGAPIQGRITAPPTPVVTKTVDGEKKPTTRRIVIPGNRPRRPTTEFNPGGSSGVVQISVAGWMNSPGHQLILDTLEVRQTTGVHDQLVDPWLDQASTDTRGEIGIIGEQEDFGCSVPGAQ